MKLIVLSIYISVSFVNVYFEMDFYVSNLLGLLGLQRGQTYFLESPERDQPTSYTNKQTNKNSNDNMVFCFRKLR